MRNSEYLIGGRPLKPKPSTVWSEKTYREILKKISTLKVNPETIFLALDMRKENKLSLPDFTRGLKEIADFLSPEEQNLLADEFDARGDGIINYRQFLNKLEDYKNRKQTADRVTQGLVKHCSDRGIDFDEELKRVDPRDTKKLPKPELTALLQRIGFAVSALDLHSFVEELPVDDAGSYNLLDLCKKIPKPRLHLDPQRIAGQIRAYMTDKRMTVEQLFATFDRDRSGGINTTELSNALQRMGIVGLTIEDCGFLMKEWDKKMDAKLDLEELNSALGVSLSVASLSADPYTREPNKLASQYPGPAQAAANLQPSYSQPPSSQRPVDPRAAPSSRLDQPGPQDTRGLPPADKLYSINASLNSMPYLKILTDLNTEFNMRRVAVEPALSKLDLQKTGILPTRIFLGVMMDDLRVRDFRVATPQELTALFNFFDLHNNGNIYYQEFVSKLASPEYQIGRAAKPKVNLSWNEKLYRDLVNHIRTQRLNPDVIFSRLDTRRENLLYQTDFARGLKELGDFLKPDDVTQLVEEYNVRGDGFINYRQFLTKLDETRAKAQTTENVTKALAKHISDRQINFSMELNRVDQRNTKKVTKAELTGLLQQIGFSVPSADLYTFIDDLPLDSQGYYNIAELCTKLTRQEPQVDELRVMNQIKTYMRDNRMSLDSLFRAFDRDRNGVFSLNEFTQALQTMRVDVHTSYDISLLFSLWDTKKDGKLDFDELSYGLKITNTTQVPSDQYDNPPLAHSQYPSGPGHYSAGPAPYQVQADPREPQGLPTPDKLAILNSALNAMPYPRILSDLYTGLCTRRANLDEAFSRSDANRRGVLPVKIFTTVLYDDLRALDTRACSAQELSQIVGFFDLHQSGHIFYREFLSKLRNPDYQIGGRPLKPKPKLAWSDKTYREILRAVTSRNINPELGFTRLDTRRENKLNLADFTRCLSELADFLTPEELNIIADEFDTRGDGLINYRQFLNKLEDYKAKKAAAEAVTVNLERHCKDKNLDFEEEVKKVDPRSTKKMSKADLTAFFQRINFIVAPLDFSKLLDELPQDELENYDLTALIKRIPKPRLNTDLTNVADKIRGYMTEKRLSIEQLFVAFDRDRNGSFSPLEFATMLQRMGILGMSELDISQVMKEWDSKRDGKLDMDELSVGLGITSSPIASAILSNTLGKLRSTLTNRKQTLQQFFKIHDSDFNNSLSRKELDSALASVEIYLTPQDLDIMMQQLDANRDGQISFLEFLNKYEADGKAAADASAILEVKVRNACKNKKLGDIFRVSRDATSEFVTYAEFKSGIAILDSTFTDSDFNTFFSNLDPNKTGRLSVHRLQTYFEPVETLARAATRQATLKPHWAEKWVIQIKDYCKRTNSPLEEVLGRYTSIPQVFTFDEFSGAMNMLTLDIDQTTTDKLITEFKVGMAIPVKSVVTWINGTITPDNDPQANRNTRFTTDEPFTEERSAYEARKKAELRISDSLNKTGFSEVEPYFPQQVSQAPSYSQAPLPQPGRGRPVADPYSHDKPIQSYVDSKTTDVQGPQLAVDDRGRYPAESFFSRSEADRNSTSQVNRNSSILSPKPVETPFDGLPTLPMDDRGRFPAESYFDKLKAPSDPLLDRGRNTYDQYNQPQLGRNTYDQPTSSQPPRGREPVDPYNPHDRYQSINDPVIDRRINDPVLDRRGNDPVQDRRINDPYDRRLNDPSDRRLNDPNDRRGVHDNYADNVLRPRAVDQQPFIQDRIRDDPYLQRDPSASRLSPGNRVADPQKPYDDRLIRGAADQTAPYNLRVPEAPKHWAYLHIVKIKETLRANRMTIREAFSTFDIDKNYAISPFEFTQGLKACGIQMPNEDQLKLFDELDVNRDGRISLAEFERLLTGLENEKPTVEEVKPMLSSADLVWAEPLLSGVKQRLAEMRTSLPLFFAYPKDAKGCVSLADFNDGLYRLGMNSSSQQVQRLVRVYESQGRVNLYNFEDDVTKYGKDALAQPVRMVPAKRLAQKDKEYLYTCFDYIADCIRENRDSPNAIVARYDANRNGKIDFDEYKRMVVKELQIPSENDVFEDMFLLLDGGEGNIPARRLIDALTGVRIDQVATTMPASSGYAGGQATDPNALNSVVSSLQKLRLSLFNVFGKERGTIPTANFLQSLRNNGISLTPQTEQAIVNLLAADATKSTISLDKLNAMMPTTTQEAYNKTATSQVQRTGNAQAFSFEPTQTQQTNPQSQAAYTSAYQQSFRNTSMSAAPAVPQSELDALLNQLNAELVRMRLTAADAFQRFDTDGDGQMTRNEFLQASIDLRLMMPQESILRLFDLIDVNHSGTLSINEFSLKVSGAATSALDREATLKISKSTADEIEELFNLFDTDKDGFIDERELEKAFRAYNQNPTPQELRDIVRMMDTNRNGKIELNEFKSAMESKIKQDIMRSEDSMQDLRAKFIKADYLKQGYLSPAQVGAVLRDMGITLSEEEFRAIIAAADANQDGQIDIDEFMALMTSDGALIDPVAASAAFNIRRSRKLSPMDFMKMFSNMPEHFIPSFIAEGYLMKRNLPSLGLIPQLDSTGARFKDVCSIASPNKANIPTFLKQNPIQVGGLLCLKLATGVSIPDSTSIDRNSIVARLCRMSLFDSVKQEFVSNSCQIEARWRPDLEDRWNFEMPGNDATSDMIFRVGPTADLERLRLILEFVLVIKKERPMEMSCGFASLPLNRLDKLRTFKLPIEGGSPISPQQIKAHDIRTYRTGWRAAIAATGLSTVRQEIQGIFVDWRRFTFAETAQLESMPDICVLNKLGLQIVQVARDYCAKLLASSGVSVPQMCDTIFTQFATMVDCWDIWSSLMQFWSSPEFYRVAGADRSEEANEVQLKALINRLYIVMHSNEFELEEVAPYRTSYGMIASNREDLRTRRAALIARALRNAADARLDELNYKPFDISELTPKTTLNLDSSLIRSLRGYNKPTGYTPQRLTTPAVDPQVVSQRLAVSQRPVVGR
eukprot:CAMPEP_0204901686 /NCGR_PEP_ID=MMETSP1397-20131031/3221_1 /ASSEMBLY_ACC=CAM_ASM_000891 /TAXON_ID=49980 /ORGANISM="Climacostomum Climacostomum virens, Strain Stock W-24" /LENGTH=2959 /DNA_ID=CAMNT_0052070073 /DNA_START=53 /DNA_END=8932 /DNA_ORIENTATION=+